LPTEDEDVIASINKRKAINGAKIAKATTTLPEDEDRAWQQNLSKLPPAVKQHILECDAYLQKLEQDCHKHPDVSAQSILISRSEDFRNNQQRQQQGKDELSEDGIEKTIDELRRMSLQPGGRTKAWKQLFTKVKTEYKRQHKKTLPPELERQLYVVWETMREKAESELPQHLRGKIASAKWKLTQEQKRVPLAPLVEYIMKNSHPPKPITKSTSAKSFNTKSINTTVAPKSSTPITAAKSTATMDPMRPIVFAQHMQSPQPHPPTRVGMLQHSRVQLAPPLPELRPKCLITVPKPTASIQPAIANQASAATAETGATALVLGAPKAAKLTEDEAFDDMVDDKDLFPGIFKPPRSQWPITVSQDPPKPAKPAVQPEAPSRQKLRRKPHRNIYKPPRMTPTIALSSSGMGFVPVARAVEDLFALCNYKIHSRANNTHELLGLAHPIIDY
jgi:hypothetical protein